MKKTIAFLLMIALLLPLAACGPKTPVRGEKAGMLTFYRDPTEEGKHPVSSFEVRLSSAECEEIRTMLDGAEWIDDDPAAREKFLFDGELRFADSETVWYFGFDACVIYSDNRYAIVSDEAIGLLGS